MHATILLSLPHITKGYEYLKKGYYPFLLENPNMMYALAPSKVEIGTLREVFAVGSLSVSHIVEYGKTQGDFKIDGRYTFEIGGRNKNFSQIAGGKDSYIFADDWDMPDGTKLPLWMLGFLY